MKCNKLLCRFLCLALVLPLLSVGAMAAGYPDLPESHWAYYEMDQAISLGIIKGYDDGRIAPEDTLTWGQYLTMLERTFHPDAYARENAVVTAEELPWYLSGYYSALESGLLLDNDFLAVDEDTLMEPILRQDAAVLLSRCLPEDIKGYRHYVSTADEALSDWDALTPGQQEAVSRLYELYVINGRDDGTFGGGETIKRCDGSVLLLRVFQQAESKRYGEKKEITIHLRDVQGNSLGDQVVEGQIGYWAYYLADTEELDDIYTYYEGGGSVNSLQSEYTVTLRLYTRAELAQNEAYERLLNDEITWEEYEQQEFWLWFQGENDQKHLLLFGDADKRRFANRAEAEAHMTTVSFPVWRLDKSGNKVSSTASMSIHAALADEIVAIFTEIYDDPEQFPFNDIGGYSWRGDSATGEHNCGTAIDINANENYQIRDGKVLVGSLWKPGENAYSLDPNGSVVRIFAEHGWSWGGDAWTWEEAPNQGYHDYMHFSYMGM